MIFFGTSGLIFCFSSDDEMLIDMSDGYRTPGPPSMADLEPGQTNMSPHLSHPPHPAHQGLNPPPTHPFMHGESK